jgi:hypothetical protein
VDRVEGGFRSSRLYVFSRLSYASAVTVLVLGGLASFGGLGYAATGAGQAAESVKEALVPQERNVIVVNSSPAQQGHPEEEQIEQRLEVAAGGRGQQPPPLQTAVTEREELPFTGLALGTTFALSLILIGFGAFLRRRARDQAQR